MNFTGSEWVGWAVVGAVALAVIAAFVWVIWDEQAEQRVRRLNEQRAADYQAEQDKQAQDDREEEAG